MSEPKVCGNCACWAPPGPGNPNPMGQCRKVPPRVFMVMMGPPPVSDQEKKIIALAGARPAPQMSQPAFLSSWAPVPADGWCFEGWEEISLTKKETLALDSGT